MPNQKEDGLINLTLFIASKNKDEKIYLAKLNKVLPSYMMPNNIKIIEQMPINNSGKIDRLKLKEMI